jgi:DNA-directed RNA polymerase omega subunit
MKVVTPMELADKATSKYLGVLVSARYARELNALPKDTVPTTAETKKLTTRALEALADGAIEFRVVQRRRRSAGI